MDDSVQGGLGYLRVKELKPLLHGIPKIYPILHKYNQDLEITFRVENMANSSWRILSREVRRTTHHE
jgi:hypothetical protein